MFLRQFMFVSTQGPNPPKYPTGVLKQPVYKHFSKMGPIVNQAILNSFYPYPKLLAGPPVRASLGRQ